jgi:tRNA uridine 5-carboxymethylaminomethyl modification enzyme
LQLRHDNADQRLTIVGHRLGLVSPARWTAFQAKIALVRECFRVANNTRCGGIPISRLLKRPTFTYLNLEPEIRAVAPADIWELVEAEIKYEGYTARQTQHNKELSKRSCQKISDRFDFASVAGLSSETRQKLSKVRPTTLGQAARISGVTPADISILSIWLVKSNLQNDMCPSIAEAVSR